MGGHPTQGRQLPRHLGIGGLPSPLPRVACRFRADLTRLLLQHCNCSPEPDPPSLAVLQMSKLRLGETGASSCPRHPAAQHPGQDHPIPEPQSLPTPSTSQAGTCEFPPANVQGTHWGRWGRDGPPKRAGGRLWSQPISWPGRFLVVRLHIGDSLDSPSRGDPIPRAPWPGQPPSPPPPPHIPAVSGPSPGTHHPAGSDPVRRRQPAAPLMKRERKRKNEAQ